MAILTTTIGAYPKPDCLPVFDWFQAEGGPDTAHPTARYAGAIEEMGDEAEARFVEAAGLVIADQETCGIDIVTDGEVRRENYVYYHCRHLSGFDFDNLTERDVRGGNYRAWLPSVRGPVKAEDAFLPHDWKAAQALTSSPVKVTMPGPMTAADTVADVHYGDDKSFGADLGEAINVEVLRLVEAGCRHIQIDEPLFARRIGDALDYGFDNLERCFHGCPPDVVRTVHMCCGYPDRLDNPDYPKAPKDCYFDLAQAIDRSSINAVSVEDAHRPNDLSLLEKFTQTTVIFGIVAIAKSRIEPVEELKERLEKALDHIDADRLIAAPDCGLGILGRDLAKAKLGNMVKAAHSLA
ncbi:MAG: cobalamin-independent methionine synthase II family protein [Rhodospirillaceae bacterium]|nr:cobalamin-independent methionine synthase II family protein [Rhodospirillaceae bacterium]MBT3909224.1 cobalamin-independent methionine synthase II family protein [Rhodospirillaceae bacterium]MBT5298772.1 cobalamin-independent methionine synthase II family protein [Rhodospirillaceae bacterium]MBT5514438.1 cobalamin-independent methionine synthase II family protein [Rhodospirillaceae bacterium]MBT6086171.1 cobalamin-independent methionine synthase II family protein [Rhodospirillaceae bacterium